MGLCNNKIEGNELPGDQQMAGGALSLRQKWATLVRGKTSTMIGI